MTKVTKTLEVKLYNPNTNKQRKFQKTYDAYQKALQDAFTSGCSTQSETNDVVVNYSLNGYSKNALKQYVPQLNGDSYDANELKNNHPVRITNEGLKIDHKPENQKEWYIKKHQ